ncbi:MAG: hypothetical protein HFH93_00815 [Lachnospiraceae bacterium]|nr:hypothetical protein [Lachnospiraceae bacterium]
MPSAAKYMPPLLLFTALLTACTPEEKTMLLPQASSAESESQDSPADRDFTVKKIYTYTYDTLYDLNKSAFLAGCGDNEIHILSTAGDNDEAILEYRQVDYRYGFYDVAGGFFKTWENRNSPLGAEMGDSVYMEQLLPSPDGKQLLIYLRSAYRNANAVLLCTLGEQEPLLLYENTSDYLGYFLGSFSPEGRWVTFDASGISTDPTLLIPIYDCGRTLSQGSSPAGAGGSDRQNDYWSIGSSRLLAPDQVLYTPCGPDGDGNMLWSTGLYDEDSQPGLFSLVAETQSAGLYVRKASFLPGTAITPTLSLIEEASMPSDIQYTEQDLMGNEGMPYPVCQYSPGGETFYYMSNPLMLWTIDMTHLQQTPSVRDFPNYVWDFLALPSGDMLVALIKETMGNYTETTQSNAQTCGRENSLPSALQEYWGVLSADLYLYPAGSGEGQLLYKNLQNLIGMEYDPDTGRILLETYEDQDRSRRRCILLEL